MIRKYFFNFLLLLILPLKTWAQDSIFIPEENFQSLDSQDVGSFPASSPPRLADEKTLREIDNQKWQRASKDLDYSQDIPPEKKKEKTKQPQSVGTNVDWNFWGAVFQVLAILLLVAAIGLGIYHFSKQPRNAQVAGNGPVIDFENVDEYLIESDLQKLLNQALADKRFALALRLHYLQVIKQLSLKNSIVWSKEKTNRDYLREMRGHRFHAEFWEATAVFERVWYGDEEVSERQYWEFEPVFRKLNHSIS